MDTFNSYSQGKVPTWRVDLDWLRGHSYVFMLYTGAVAGIFAGTRWAEFHGLPDAKVFIAMLVIFPAALGGARLLFVALHWKVFRHDKKRIWNTNEGGAALYGGLMLSFVLSLPLLWLTRLPLGAFWDAVAIALLVGMIFTRTGCAVQGCCAGRPSQSWFAINMPDLRGVWCRRLPFPLFEVGVAASTLAVCTTLLRKSSGGCLFLASLAMYAGGRWLFEPTRENVDRLRNWSVHRAISVALVMLALAGLFVIRASASVGTAVAH
jgi:phosphatidylglycerol---prolipoprotein diacylglyceryl transferase